MIKLIDIKNQQTAEDILRVQLASYQIEAELIDCYDIPPLRDTIVGLRGCDEIFHGFYSDSVLSGAISFTLENDVLDIHRLMVHPDYFRQGIAQLLLDFVQSIIHNYEKIIVSTGSKNLPAICFYKKNGFVKTEEITLSEGLSITSLEKHYTQR